MSPLLLPFMLGRALHGHREGRRQNTPSSERTVAGETSLLGQEDLPEGVPDF
jgi:hypothetical protein